MEESIYFKPRSSIIVYKTRWGERNSRLGLRIRDVYLAEREAKTEREK